MKRITVLVAFSLATIGRAFAADLPPANLPPPVVMPPPARAPATYIPSTEPVLYNWGGLYFGINGGYGFGSGSFGGSKWTFPAGTTFISGCAAGCTTGAFGTDGGIVGSTFGANYQAGPMVLGFEADIDWSDIYGAIPIPLRCAPVAKQRTTGSARHACASVLQLIAFSCSPPVAALSAT